MYFLLDISFFLGCLGSYLNVWHYAYYQVQCSMDNIGSIYVNKHTSLFHSYHLMYLKAGHIKSNSSSNVGIKRWFAVFNLQPFYSFLLYINVISYNWCLKRHCSLQSTISFPQTFSWRCSLCKTFSPDVDVWKGIAVFSSEPQFIKHFDL